MSDTGLEVQRLEDVLTALERISRSRWSSLPSRQMRKLKTR
jgi:hypothetical protein